MTTHVLVGDGKGGFKLAKVDWGQPIAKDEDGKSVGEDEYVGGPRRVGEGRKNDRAG